MSSIRSVGRRSSLNIGSPEPYRSRSAERSVRNFGEPLQLTAMYDVEEKETEEALSRECPPSEMSISRQVKSHRRVMSDPFDNADLDESNVVSEDDHSLREESQFALPTLQRFPFAETSNRNCWSEPPAKIFSVRGPGYLSDKKKITSEKYLLSARGCDLFLSDNASACDMGSLAGALGGKLRQQPSLLIRLTFPWGILIQYYEIPTKLAGFMRPGEKPSSDGFSQAERTLAAWLSGNAAYRSERLKLISYVPEGPYLVRKMVTGKPAIIGKKLPVKYKYTPQDGSKMDFLECELDIGSSSATARRIVSVCRRYMSALTVDIGFVIEGKTPAELPEEMMGAIRVHEIDPIKAPTI